VCMSCSFASGAGYLLSPCLCWFQSKSSIFMFFGYW
jgi:hypothetical protein